MSLKVEALRSVFELMTILASGTEKAANATWDFLTNAPPPRQEASAKASEAKSHYITLQATDRFGHTWFYRVNTKNPTSCTIVPPPAGAYTNLSGIVFLPDNLGWTPVSGVDPEAFASCSGIEGFRTPKNALLTGITLNTGDRSLRVLTYSEDTMFTDRSDRSSTYNVRYSYDSEQKIQWKYRILPLTNSVILLEGIFDLRNPSSVIIPTEIDDFPVAVLGEKLFAGKYTLKSVSIPSSVHTIEAEAFDGCTCLESINFPEYLKKIGNHAFRDCRALPHLNLPHSLKQIGDGAFKNCGYVSLRGKMWSEDERKGFRYLTNNFYVSKDRKRLLEIREDKKNKVSYTVPEGIEVIAQGVFRDNPILTTVILPSSLRTIESNVFENCTRLKEIVLPESLVSLGESVFRNCAALSVTVPLGVKTIGEGTFSGCLHVTLKEKQLRKKRPRASPANVRDTTYGDCIVLPVDAYRDCSDIRGVFTVHEGVRSIDESAFDGCKYITEIRLPSTLESIEKHAFRNCGSLKKCILPQKLTYLGAGAFKGCAQLEEITIPPNIKEINTETFRDCSALCKIKVEATLISIGTKAFYNCTALESSQLPSDIPLVEEDAYTGCKASDEYLLPKELFH